MRGEEAGWAEWEGEREAVTLGAVAAPTRASGAGMAPRKGPR